MSVTHNGLEKNITIIINNAHCTKHTFFFLSNEDVTGKYINIITKKHYLYEYKT